MQWNPGIAAHTLEAAISWLLEDLRLDDSINR
jgi:hypothetical protein